MLNLGNLQKLINAARYAPQAHAATTGNVAAADRLVRELGPQAASILLGPEGASLFTSAVQFADARGWTQPQGASVTEIPAGAACTVCAPWYSASGERKVVRDIRGLDGGLVFVLGLRKTGKTALAARLCELWDRDTYAWGISQDKLPPGWHELRVPVDQRVRRVKRRTVIDADTDAVEDDDASEELDSRPHDWLEEALPHGSSLIVDDAGIVLDSASSGGGAVKAFKHLVQIIRHLNINCVVNVQYAAAVTKYSLDADAIFLKPPPMMWQAIERQELAPFITEAEPFWQAISESERKRHAWVISSEYRGPVHFQLPSFWSDRLSYNKGHR
jgi:hypothetical protein